MHLTRASRLLDVEEGDQLTNVNHDDVVTYDGLLRMAILLHTVSRGDLEFNLCIFLMTCRYSQKRITRISTYGSLSLRLSHSSRTSPEPHGENVNYKEKVEEFGVEGQWSASGMHPLQ